MNKYQQFAVMHYLMAYGEDLTFDEILAACQSDDRGIMIASEAYAHLTLEEIADDIYQMACDLQQLL